MTAEQIGLAYFFLRREQIRDLRALRAVLITVLHPMP